MNPIDDSPSVSLYSFPKAFRNFASPRYNPCTSAMLVAMLVAMLIRLHTASSPRGTCLPTQNSSIQHLVAYIPTAIFLKYRPFKYAPHSDTRNPSAPLHAIKKKASTETFAMQHDETPPPTCPYYLSNKMAKNNNQTPPHAGNSSVYCIRNVSVGERQTDLQI